MMEVKSSDRTAPKKREGVSITEPHRTAFCMANRS